MTQFRVSQVLSALWLMAVMSLVANCSRLTDHTQSLALECQISRNDANSGRFLQIRDAAGAKYEGARVSALRAVFAGSDGANRALTVSGRGCVELPSATGKLYVTSPLEGLAIVADVAAAGESLATLNLAKQARVVASLPCPSPGYFANHGLQLPWSFTFEGEPATERLVIRAVDAKTSVPVNVFVKEFDRSALPFKGEVATDRLPEGEYRLEALRYAAIDGVGAAPVQLTDGTCPLTILRRPPLGTASLTLGDAATRVYAPGEAFAGLTALPDAQLLACAEDRSMWPSRADGSCEASGPCRDKAAFQSVATFSEADPGLYNVFSFRRDRAGNESGLSCLTAAVSAEAPKLSVQWQNEAWNQAVSTYKEPVLSFKARISVAHDVLPAGQLDGHLMCKVEFVLAGQDLLSNAGVMCNAGACQGRSLNDYQPCGEDVSFTLHEAWSQRALQTSLMRLRVKADDGAGHIAEASSSVWINDDAWKVDALPNHNANNLNAATDLVISNNGDVLAEFTNNRIMLWSSEQWNDVSPVFDLPIVQRPSLLKTMDHEIYATWISSLDGKIVTDVALWNDTARRWNPPFILPASCHVALHPTSGFWCVQDTFDSTFDAYFVDHGAQLATVLGPAHSDPCGINGGNGQTRFQELFLVCGDDNFLLRPNQAWERISNLPTGDMRMIQRVSTDNEGRTWIVREGVRANVPNQLGYFSETESFHLVEPPTLNGNPLLPRSEMMNVDHSGRMELGAYVWSNQSWALNDKLTDLPVDAWADLHPLAPTASDVEAFEGNGDIYYWGANGLVEWPLTHIHDNLKAGRILYRRPDSSFWTITDSSTDVLRFYTAALVKQDQALTGLPDNSAFPWLNGDTLQSYAASQGLVAEQEGLWTSASAPLADRENSIISHLSTPDGSTYLSFYNELWRKKPSEKSFASVYLNTGPIPVSPHDLVERVPGEVWFVLGDQPVLVRIGEGMPQFSSFEFGGFERLFAVRGHLYVQTSQGFVEVVNPSGNATFVKRDPSEIWTNGSVLPAHDYFAADLDHGDLFIETQDSIYLAKADEASIRVIPKPSPDFRTALALTPSGDLLFATASGLFLYQNNGWRLILTREQIARETKAQTPAIERMVLLPSGRIIMKVGEIAGSFAFDDLMNSRLLKLN